MATLYFNVKGGIQTGNVIIDASSGNITGVNNATLGNLVAANYFSGNGYFLFGLDGSNVLGQVGNALVAGTVYSNAQPNITSLGTLSSVTVSGNVSSGNVIATGDVSGSTLTGTITTAAQPNITSLGTLSSISATGNISTSGNLVAAQGIYAPTIYGNVVGNISGTLAVPGSDKWVLYNQSGNAGSSTNLQFDYNTSVLTISGNITTNNANLGNLAVANYFSGDGGLLGNITGGNVTGTVANATYATSAGSATTAGTVTTNAQPNITSVGTLSSLSVTNLTTATGGVKTSNIIDAGGTNTISVNSGTVGIVGNLQVGTGGTGNVTATYFIGDGSLLTNLTAGNITGQVANALVAGTVYTNAQPNITSVGTLSSLSVSGNLTSGNLSSAGQLNLSGTTEATGTGTGTLIVAGGASVTKDLWVGGTIHAPNLDITTYNQLSVDVPLLYLEANVPYPYSYDSGFYTRFYGDTSTASNVYQHSGFVRDHSTNKWYLFSNAAEPSGGTIDFANANLVLDTLKLGGLDLTGNATISGNITVGNASLGNLATANYFSGDGGLLSNITGGNVTGQVGNALVASTVYSNAQPNITSVGTLNGVTVNGTLNATGASNVALGPITNVHISGGSTGYLLQTDGAGTLSFVAPPSTSTITNGTSNVAIPAADGNVNISVGGTANVVVVTTNSVNVTGNITSGNASLGNLATANYFSGNGSLLTSITGGNVTGQVANALVAGTVYSNAQPNITSVGTLSSVDVSGNVSSGGNIIGNGQYLTNLTGGNVTGQVGNALVAGTVYSNAQPNITSLGTLASLDVTANVAAGNILTNNLLYANGVAWDLQQAAGNTGEIQFNSSGDFGATSGLTWNSGTSTLTATNISGNGAALTSLTGGNVTGQVGNALVASTVYSNAQPNITSLGTLNSLAVTGSVTAGNIVINGGILSNRANVSVTTNTVIDEFDPGAYRSAKYVVSASGTNGYQSAEIILVQDGTNSYISIYGSVCSNATADIVDFSSNINGISGNVTIYATASGASTKVNLVATYLKT